MKSSGVWKAFSQNDLRKMIAEEMVFLIDIYNLFLVQERLSLDSLLIN